jgi:hypothetical protein
VSSIGVVIPGRFVDAYVYMDFLFACEASGRARMFSLDDIAREAANASRVPHAQARALFADNRLLAGGNLQASNFQGDVVEVPAGSLAAEEVPLSINAATVFDTTITYLTLFLATDAGLLSVPLDPGTRRSMNMPSVRLSLPCYQANPRWGGVAASCGRDGLWALVNEWGFGEVERQTSQLDEAESNRNAWMGFSLVSFAGRADLKAFSADVPMGRGKKRIASQFSEDTFSVGDFVPGRMLDDLSDPWTLVAAVGGAIVLITRDEVLLIPTLRHEGALWSFANGTKSIGSVSSRPLNVVETDGGYVIETSRSLYYYHAEGQQQVIDQEAIAVRAYPRSRRFRRLITATVEGGVLLACMLGEHPFPRSEWFPTLSETVGDEDRHF